ncbi:MAG: F0F1 ATP synthase subunit B [Coxiellaceae bacterium]|nr:F0F1 ATP synthase subunit B [Coxiellaceae bacterium]
MDLNLTLLGEMITFAVFIWFTMKYVWPPLMNIMEERRKKIADGLAAGEQGEKELEMARIKVKEQLLQAKKDAAAMLEQANQRASHIIEEAKAKAREEGERLLEIAQGEIEQEFNAAKERLMKDVSKIAVAGAERILQREVDKTSNDRLVQELVGEA